MGENKDEFEASKSTQICSYDHDVTTKTVNDFDHQYFSDMYYII